MAEVYVNQYVLLEDIKVEGRQRKDKGDLSDLVSSIKEYGILQPIVLAPIDATNSRFRLVDGERRLSAMKQLGWTDLEHGVHFVWLAEQNRDEFRRTACELEENLRRKSLDWQEEVNAKAKLLEIMQKIYGPPAVGAPTRAEKSGSIAPGFGVNKLASMLGESATLTSKDLHLAKLLKVAPALGKQATKNSALRAAQVLVSIASMTLKAQAQPEGESQWILHEGDLRSNAKLVADGSVDLIYTDLPFGVDLGTQHSHNKGLVQYADPLDEVLLLLPEIARESYRVLANDRYAVFWFGWRFYIDLLGALKNAGFAVDIVPFVWWKHAQASEAPHMKYANVYGVAIVARKGSPVFIRQGQPNFIDLGNVVSSERMHIAQQPIELVKRFINDMVPPGAVILDWCAGSATTGVAALQCNCKVILFEREPLAIAAAKARLGEQEAKDASIKK